MAGETQELTREEAIALLKKRGSSAASPEMSREEGIAYLKGIKRPEPPSALQAFAGQALEGLSTIPGLAAKVTDYLGGTMPSEGVPQRGGGRLSPQDQASRYASGPQVGAQVFGPAEQLLKGSAQAVLPEEQRGRGGFWSETIPGTLGQMAATVPVAFAGGPAAAMIAYGAQSGVPLYYQIKAKTGDEEAAALGLIFGFGVGQLEKFGAEKAASSLVKKLLGKGLGEAIEGLAVRTAVGVGKGAAAETGTGVLQTALEDKIYEALSDDDIDNWESIKRSIPPSLLLGGFAGGLDAAIQRGKARADGTGGDGRPLISQKSSTAPEALSFPSDRATPPPELTGVRSAAEMAHAAPEAPTAPTQPQEAGVATAAPQPSPAAEPAPSPSQEAPSASATAPAEPSTAPVAASEPSAESVPQEQFQRAKPEAEPDEETMQMFGGLPPLRGKASEPAAVSRGRLKRAGQALLEGVIKTHGGKPEAAALMEERARGEVEVAAGRARSASLAAKRAIKRYNRKAPAKITNATLQEALTSPEALAKLPDVVRPTVEKMRAQSDALSRIVVDEGMTSQTMSEVIEGRMGEYLRRSYKAHQDPEWAQRVPQDVRNRLESLLVSWAEPLKPEVVKRLQATAFAEGRPKTMAQREAHFELQSRRRLQGAPVEDIRAQMSAMLQDAKRVAENPWAAFAKSKLKRQDVSLFKARKGLPVEMRNFLGEEKDPYVNYTNTILKQASFVATHRKFREMRAEGMGKWLHEKPTVKDGIEYTTRVSVEDNPRLAPLVGDKPLYTTEGIKKALFDSDRTLANPFWRAVVVANALLKGTKTIYQVYAIPKQLASQITTLMRNGHLGYAIAHPHRVMAAMWGFGAEGEALHEDLIRLQVLDSSVAAAEFKDMQDISRNRQLNEPYRSAAKGNEWIAAGFSQPDNFAKTAGWLKEVQSLMKAGLDEESAKRRAADTVKNLYPTYSRIVKWAQQFRRQPLIGTFVAFKAEQVRTTIEQLRLISADLKSDNPKLRALGRRRAAFMLAGSALAPTSAVAWNMLNGVDQEEDERRRQKVRDYDRQRDLVWIDKDSYTDLSDIDDRAWLTDPLMRVIAGEDAEDILAEMYHENVEPFLSLSFVSEALAELAWGRTKYGAPIKDHQKWLEEKVKPSSWKNLKLSDLTGLRVQKADAKKDYR